MSTGLSFISDRTPACIARFRRIYAHIRIISLQICLNFFVCCREESTLYTDQYFHLYRYNMYVHMYSSDQKVREET